MSPDEPTKRPARTEKSLEDQVDEFLSSRSNAERLLLFASAPSVLAGIAYAATEYFVTHTVKDWVFIVLLALATVFITSGTIYLRRLLTRTAVILFRNASPLPAAGPSSFSDWKLPTNGPGDLLDLVFHRRAMLICAVAYGALLGASPIILGMHFPNLCVQILLMVFMYCSNAVTGAVLYSAITLLKQSWHLAKRLEIRLFDGRDAARAHRALLARLSIVTALYIGLCQASVVFSPFSGPWVFAYAFFALFIFMAIYFIPQIPIYRRLSEERDIALSAIDRERSKLFSAELTPHAVDELYKLNDIETKLSGISLGFATKDTWLVTAVSIVSFSLPYISSAAKLFLPFFVRQVDQFKFLDS